MPDIRFAKKDCCICGGRFFNLGNSAEPFSGGRCCDHCNDTFVQPVRMLLGHTASKNMLQTLRCLAKEGRLGRERRAISQAMAHHHADEEA